MCLTGARLPPFWAINQQSIAIFALMGYAGAKGGGGMELEKTGALMAQARKERGLTQKELAQSLHVSTQAVSKWERGLSFPDVSLLESLSRRLGLTVSELLSGERNTPPREELVRSTLQVSLRQQGTKIRTWRWLFLLTAGMLLGVGALQGYGYIRDNTKLLPQRETVVSYRESTPAEELAADVAGQGSDICFFDVTYADDVTAVSLQMELWTAAGLEKTWDLGWIGYGRPDDTPRHETLALAPRVEFGRDGAPDRFHLGFATGGARWSGTLEDVPYLGAGFGSVALGESAALDRGHGAVLMCYTLDPTGTGRWRAGHWLGDVEAPAVEENQAFLLVRLLCEYE